MRHFISWLNKLWPIIVLTLFVGFTYRQFFWNQLLPIPADTIVGLYHPWRDFYLEQYPSGIPYKNHLVTDAVRQLYPWRFLAISQLKEGVAPLWNSFSFSGMPLAANLQAATYYPLNGLYWLTDFATAWSLQVVLQTILGGVFMMLFLRQLKLQSAAIALGTLAWVGSGFFVAWLTSNTLVQVAIWLPLLFTGIEIVTNQKKNLWGGAIIAVAICCSFLAGALQIFGYCLVAGVAYTLYQDFTRRSIRTSSIVLIGSALGLGLAFPQWRVLLPFSFEVVRSVSDAAWMEPGWFLPWQNLIQFIAPDFFGNPATLNYFGVWNYMEFVGYVGLVPLVFSVSAALFQFRKNVFWVGLIIIAVLLATPNPISALPFAWKFPFFSLGQPTRLLVLIDFSLAILAAKGLQSMLTKELKLSKIIATSGVIAGIIGTLYGVALFFNLAVSRQNLILPTVLIIVVVLLLFLATKSKFTLVAVSCLVIITIADLGRFMTKFTPFTSRDQLYPQTQITKYLSDQAKSNPIRVVALDDRIMPPNFSIMYGIPMASGYDSFFLKDYALLLGKIEGTNNFNRIITPKNLAHPLFPLLGVNYVLSFDPLLPSDGASGTFAPIRLTYTMNEGQTHLYQVMSSLPRAFFVSNIFPERDEFIPSDQAIAEGVVEQEFLPGGMAKIVSYSNNEVKIEVVNETDGFLVLLDTYYPSWQATVDGKPTKIYRTDYAFRGVFVPANSHQVIFTVR